MSIWGSIVADEADFAAVALDNLNFCTNYHGAGNPDMWIDVATACSYHSMIRLLVIAYDSTDSGHDRCETLIDANNARRLAACLMAAADQVDKHGYKGPHVTPCPELRR